MCLIAKVVRISHAKFIATADLQLYKIFRITQVSFFWHTVYFS